MWVIELSCPYCGKDHEIPEDCTYGGEFTASCGNLVEVVYDTTYNEDEMDVQEWWHLHTTE